MSGTRTSVWNPAGVVGKFLFSPTLGQRSLAMLIDLALVTLIQLAVGQVAGVYQAPSLGMNNATANGAGVTFYATQTTTVSYFWLAAIVVVYFTAFEATFGATPGKALLRLQVALLDGGRPGFGAILMRNVLRLVDALPFFYLVGGLVAENTVHEQRVGDIVAHTTVIPRTHLDEPPGRLRLKLLLTALVLAALIAVGIAYQYFGRAPLILQSWANANNSYQGPTTAPTATTPLCAPMPEWPDVPAASGDGTARPIVAWALGVPQWSDGEMTYPFREQLWNSATDRFQPPASPQQVALADLGSGPDVYSGQVRMSWVGPLNGGWEITGGQISCARAG